MENTERTVRATWVMLEKSSVYNWTLRGRGKRGNGVEEKLSNTVWFSQTCERHQALNSRRSIMSRRVNKKKATFKNLFVKF